MQMKTKMHMYLETKYKIIGNQKFNDKKKCVCVYVRVPIEFILHVDHLYWVLFRMSIVPGSGPNII